MSEDTTTPDAEQPATVAQTLFEMDCVAHTSGDSNFKSAGVSYEVKAWLDEDESAGDVARVCKAIQRAGYCVDTVGTVEKTGSVKVTASDD